MAIEVNDNDFQSEVLDSNIPVLVDFWAPWCGPCRMVTPILEKLSGEYAGRVKICKVNVDHAPQIAGKYGIRAIPTLMIFKGGEMVEQIIGVQPREAIAAKLDAVLT